MKIFLSDSDIVEVIPDDDAYTFKELMGDNLVSLTFSSTSYIGFPIGAYIFVNNTKYTMYELPNFTKVNERNWEYTLTFCGAQKQLERYKFRNMQDGRLKFTLTAQPQEFLEHIINNLNARDPEKGWSVGDYLVCAEKTQSFSHNSIRECLDAVASLFETEWRIDDKKISLCKAEYNKENPIALSYGKGNGFQSGVSQQVGSETAVDVLFIQGGEKNIDSQNYTYSKDGATYHASSLRLPRNYRAWYHPSDDATELGEIVNYKTSDDDMEIKTDADGFCLERVSKVNNGYESSLELTDIYPSHTCKCTKVTESNPDSHFWEVYDEENPVDYEDSVIAGETMTIIFQSGMLTGKEFDLSSYNHESKKFEIVPQEIDGITMPDRSSGYYPQEGDEFVVFNVQLPQEYIDEAEQDLLLNAAAYLYKRSEVEVSFQGTIDGIWASQNWNSLIPYFRLGGYVKFTDKAFCKDGKLLRITAIKETINKPHYPELTLSNSSVGQTISSEIKKISTNQVYNETQRDSIISFAKRTFRDAKETATKIEQAVTEIENFDYGSSINPATVRTMMLLIGDESLQFEFGSTTAENEEEVTDWKSKTYEPTWTSQGLYCPNADFRHLAYTSAQGAMVSSSAAVSYPYWRINSENQYFVPEDSEKAYYLYLVAPKSGTSNLGKMTASPLSEFKLFETSQSNTDTFYYFLVGILNSETDGTRSYSSVFGKTEILGNRVATDIIKSNDGSMYIDLINGIIQGKFNFVSGLISNSVYLGDSEDTATAGIKGDYDIKRQGNLVFWVKPLLADDYTAGILDNGNIFCKELGVTAAGCSFKDGYINLRQIRIEIDDDGNWGISNLVDTQLGKALSVKGKSTFEDQVLKKISLSTGSTHIYDFVSQVPSLIWSGSINFLEDSSSYGIQTSEYGCAHLESDSSEKVEIKSITRNDTGDISIVFNYYFKYPHFVTILPKKKSGGGICNVSKYDEGVSTETSGDYTYMKFYLGDDNTLNDGSFELQVWSMGQAF